MSEQAPGRAHAVADPIRTARRLPRHNRFIAEWAAALARTSHVPMSSAEVHAAPG